MPDDKKPRDEKKYLYGMSMSNWWNKQLISIDCETTGLDPTMHEIWDIAFVPLDASVNQRKDVAPLVIKMRPENPELIDWSEDIMKGNKTAILDAIETGFSQDKAIDIFLNWREKLKLPLNKSGYNTCKIIPLGHNYAGFDKFFLQQWLGVVQYNEIFDYHVRDTCLAVNFINDRAGYRNEPIPYAQARLVSVADHLCVERGNSHRALDDALVTAKIYKALLHQGGLF